MKVGEMCRRTVVTCEGGASAAEVARLMREQHVGDVVVVRNTGASARPLGVVTDRDLVVQVMAGGVGPDSVTAADLMSPVVTAQASEDVYDAIWHMRRHGCRRLPVVDDEGVLVGLTTVDDLTQLLAEELTELARVSPLQRNLETERRGPAR